MIMDLHMKNQQQRVAFSENVLQDIGIMRGKYEKYGKNLRILHLSADAPISARWNGNGLVNYQMRKTSAIDTKQGVNSDDSTG
jgi:lipopolysaccharide assembly outer membrane protein LptD (OstA)